MEVEDEVIELNDSILSVRIVHALKNRRRSSAYRPSSYYPDNLEKGCRISIESLPMAILCNICNYSRTDDLLSLCLTSKFLYLPAVVFIYRRIIVTEETALIKTAKAVEGNIFVPFGTLIHISNAPLLFRTLSSTRKLASHVRGLVFTNQSSSKIMEQEDVKAALFRTVGLLRLKEFKFPSMSLNDFYKLSQIQPFHSLQILVLNLSDFNQEKLNLVNLKHLKIYYSNKPERKEEIKKAYEALSDILNKLVTLEFEEVKENLLLNTLNYHNSNSTEAVWIYFFELLKYNSVSLSIARLGLDGYIANHGRSLSLLFREVLELEKLTALQLHITESSHSHETHFDVDTKFLNNITKFTPSLTNVSINPTHDCLFCQHDSLIDTISYNVPNQLKVLVLTFETPNLTYSKMVVNEIYRSQKNLSYLGIYDKSREAYDKVDLSKLIDSTQLSNYEHAVFYNLQIRTIYCSIFLEDFEIRSIITNGYMSSLFKEAYSEVGKFLKSCMISNNAPREGQGDQIVTLFNHLPCIRMLSIFKLAMVFKDNNMCFIVDGKYVPV